MEGTLRFELPKDTAEFQAACHARSTLLGVQEFSVWLKNEVRFPEGEVTEEEWAMLLKILHKWNSIWDNRNSNFTPVTF
jgi:hypothetical protein